jgi:mannose-6-phosphate isomerase
MRFYKFSNNHIGRPWGHQAQYVSNARATAQAILLKAGQAFEPSFPKEPQGLIYRVVRGEGVLVRDNKHRPLKAGSQYQLDGDEPHELQATTNLAGMVVAFGVGEVCNVKLLCVNPGEQLSLQYHEKRSEDWYVLAGKGTLVHGPDELLSDPAASLRIDYSELEQLLTKEVLTAGDKVHNEPGRLHRIIAGDDELWFLEVTGGHFDEADNFRVHDIYDRPATEENPFN